MKSSLSQTVALLGVCLFLEAAPAWAQLSENQNTQVRPQPTQTPPPPEHAAQAVARALEGLEGEPSLEELERAALEVAQADPGSVEGWVHAPRRSAWLPVLKISADHRRGRDESLDRDQVHPDEWGADTDRGLGIGVSIQWNLSELVFNADEIRVHKALEDRAKRREAILTTLINAWFERRRLQLELQLKPPTDPLEYARLSLAVQSLGATIDALTGGRLSRNLSKHRVFQGP